MLTCPKCGTPEKARVKVCSSCGEAYATEDLHQLSKLEFLVEETASWDVPEKLRRPYLDQLRKLRERLLPPLPAPELVEEVVVPDAPPAIEVEPAPEVVEKPKPPREKVPFDQWLLSTRNINIALYTGGLLLILAGLIFIGVNWTRIPGWGKFTVTLFVTGLMYLGGLLLFRRPAYRIGGVALIAIASAFFTLNFAVLQIYVLRQAGISDELMWLIASAVCIPLYGLTAYLTKNSLFSVYTQAAVISCAGAAVFFYNATIMADLVVSAGIALGFLLLAWFVKTSQISAFTFKPFIYLANLGMPIIAAISAFAWILNQNCVKCTAGSPWLAIIALGCGVIFYGVTDLKFQWKITRWIAAPLLALTAAFILYQLKLDPTLIGIVLLVISLLFLGGGYYIERRNQERSGSWPIYITAYLTALYVTTLALPYPEELFKVLFGDVLILAFSAVIFRTIWFVYGSVWLLIWPVYLTLNLNISLVVYQGVGLAILSLVYSAGGYIIGQRKQSWSGPPLTAAGFLSPIVIFMVWPDRMVVSLALIVYAVAYLLIGLWFNWNWLILPALVSLNVAVFTLNDLIIPVLETRNHALIISYQVLGILSVLGGYYLGKRDRDRWSWPLYITGLLNLIGAYGWGIISDNWIAVLISTTTAAICLTFAWLMREGLEKIKAPPLLTYLGLLVLFGVQYHLYRLIGRAALDNWPVYSVGLCAFFVFLAWLIHREVLIPIYGRPLWYTGLALLIVPLAGVVSLGDPLLGTISFTVSGLTLLGVGFWKKTKIPIMTDLGLLVLFASQYYLYNLIGGMALEHWPIFSAGVCILYILLSRLMVPRASLTSQGKGFLYSGLVYLLVPLGGSLFLDQPITGAISFVLAGLTYLVVDFWGKIKTPLLTYFGLLVLFGSQYYLFNLAGGFVLDNWPIFSAGLCALYVILAWILERDPALSDHSTGFRFSGLIFSLVPLAGSLILADHILGAITFGMVGMICTGLGLWRKIFVYYYLGIFNLIAVIIEILVFYQIEEPQGYILPIGLALMVVGWLERLNNRRTSYLIPTYLGLIILMGSALYQSLPRSEYLYALLLGCECILAVWLGIKQRLRGYVQFGVIVLFLNAIVQFGPGFVELPRWIQIGVTGTILLGGGLAALFRREQILSLRKSVSDEMKSWEM